MPGEAPSRDAAQARALFPRGMIQPEGGYRFSLDPLLLACFARPRKGTRLLDLGSGCGVAALAVLLRGDGHVAEALGLDIDQAMTQAAAANAGRLGLAHAFTAGTADVRDIRNVVAPESFGLALTNPPYYRPGEGTACAEPARSRARSEQAAELGDFLAAAAYALTAGGRLAVVYPAGELAGLAAACRERRLEPKRLRLVHSRTGGPAKLLLLEAVKNGGRGLAVEWPLVLYKQDTTAGMTRQALQFCPFLACNA